MSTRTERIMQGDFPLVLYQNESQDAQQICVCQGILMPNWRPIS